MQVLNAAERAAEREATCWSVERLRRFFNVIYTDVLDKENVYTALSRQNGRLLNTLQC